MARLLWQSLQDIDVRDVLKAVRAPTLVIARREIESRPMRPPQRWRTAFQARNLTLPPGEHDAIDIVELLARRSWSSSAKAGPAHNGTGALDGAIHRYRRLNGTTQRIG